MSDEGGHEPGIGSLVIGALGLGVPGILLILILIGGISIFAGLAIYSVITFITNWFILIISLIVGIVAVYELVPYGPKYALIGVSILVIAVITGFVMHGILGDPSNSFNLLMSVAPSNLQQQNDVQPVAIPFVVYFGTMVVIAIGLVIYGTYRVGKYFDEW